MLRLSHTCRRFEVLSLLAVALFVWAVGAGTKLGAAAGAPSALGGGSPLIGQLEGPEVITDPAKFPTTFKEAPQLAELVKAGKLPPVAERIGQDPLVIKPVHEIGRYGGTWRRGFTGPADKWNGYRAASGPDHILFWDYTGDKVVPNIAKDWKMEEGGRTLILHLRRGMKWSDGQPFTADDFVFWFEDIYRNKELVPTPSSTMMINGKPGVLEKIDIYTVRFKFPDPYYMLPDVLAGSTSLGGHAYQGLNGMGGFAPAHYLKPFHPRYVSKEELDRKVKEAKFDNWVRLFLFKNDWALNPELPVVTPWKTVTPINTPIWTLERNPYSIWVDTEGNQLPYIDKVVMTLAENLEVINLRAIAGEYDFQARHLDLSKVPVFLENQKKGRYKLSLDTADSGCDACLKFNMNYDADPEIGKWLANTDFRRAVSLGINRDQLNEIFWLGLGTPGSLAPAESNLYSPGPEYRTLWSTYDPDKANQMLDRLGLTAKDSEGFRLRTDGKGRLVFEINSLGAQFLQFTQIAEAIAEQWKKIGIKANVVELERSLATQRVAANQQQMRVSWGDGSEHLFTFPFHVFPFDSTSEFGPLYGRWFASGGTQGKEPQPRLRELMGMYSKAFGVPTEERIKLGKEIWKIVIDEQWSIGIVGLSPAAMGVRVAKVDLGNIPARQFNSPDTKTPSISRTVTFFWRK